MTANTQQIEKTASREATDWFILLGEEPEDVELRRNFEKWLSQSPVNATAWYAMGQASDGMDKAKPVHSEKWMPLLATVRENADFGRVKPGFVKPAPENLPPHSLPNPARDRTARTPSWFGGLGRLATFGGAGFAVAACLLAVVSGPGILRDLQSDYATGTAETRIITLADGSMVTLAPESAISVAYDVNERHVRLLDGEAFFDVTPNPQRPFRVDAEDVKTTVLGTAFDVLQAENGINVSVEHGLVRVDYAKGGLRSVTEMLAAGQSVHLGWSGDVTRSDKPVSHVATWRQQQLVARDQPLGTVIDQLRRYYSGKIIVLDDALALEPVTGVYNLADPMEALYGIARAQNADLWQVSPWIVIVSR